MVVSVTTKTTMVMMLIVTIKFITIDIAPKSIFLGEGAAVHKLKTGGWDEGFHMEYYRRKGKVYDRLYDDVGEIPESDGMF